MKQLYKKVLPVFLLGALMFCSEAIAQLDLPRGSQMAKVSQRIGITDATIIYSRPSVNDREVWGALVPYGMNNLGFAYHASGRLQESRIFDDWSVISKSNFPKTET